ncbi:Translation machinery-associated protein 22 [Umbelopsis nana]
MPPEYCEFSGTQEKCKTWLQKNHENVYNKIYNNAEEVEKGVEGITLEEKPEEKKNDRSHVKDKSAQLEAKLEKENKKKMESHVIIKRVERTKRKCVTTIHGLEVFDVDLKKAAKMFANRFACGSSVAKNNQNQDEIVVQGDFSDELLDLILANWPHIPEDNIDLVEDKKKK